MVVAVVASLAGFVKARVSKTQVDNTVFRLHYRWTTSFCYLCCALIAASDFIGEPIQCQNAAKAVATYCWVSSTYTINTTNKHNDFTYYESYGSSFSGVGAYNPDIHQKTFHAYYQWVPFILFFQGCLFYLPHYIWKTMEGKRLENLLQGLNAFTVIDDSFEKKKENIIKYLHNSHGLNKKYCLGYIFCELLNFVNVVGQMFMLDAFFGGMFLHYGTKILLLPTEEDKGRFDPMIETFPRVTKCEFHTFGASGTRQIKDYLCILPHNILNEKIFLVMWIWFVVLACATSIQLMFRAAMLQFPVIRLKLLEQRGKLGTSYELDPLIRRMHLGDFLLLYAIAHNVSALCFKDILKGLQNMNQNSFPTAPLTTVSPAYNNSFVNDLDGNTMDLKLRKKIMEDTNV